MVREEMLNLVLVPPALAALAGYHVWLLYTILRHPTRTVIGVNAIARKRWVAAMMANTEKNGVLAIQTLRNNIMASTVLSTTAITLVSVISVIIGVASPSSSSSSSLATPHRLAYGSKVVTPPSSSSSPLLRLVFAGSSNRVEEVFAAKYLAVSLCFMLAFVCNVQAIRLYAHASFLLGGMPPGEGAGARADFAAYVSRTVNNGSYAWSLGLRAFYVSMALFLWTFGPVPMLAGSVLMCGMLYFLDTTRGHAGALGHGVVVNGQASGNGTV